MFSIFITRLRIHRMIHLRLYPSVAKIPRIAIPSTSSCGEDVLAKAMHLPHMPAIATEASEPGTKLPMCPTNGLGLVLCSPTFEPPGLPAKCFAPPGFVGTVDKDFGCCTTSSGSCSACPVGVTPCALVHYP